MKALRMVIVTAMLVAGGRWSLQAQEFNRFVDRVQSLKAPAARQAVVDSFISVSTFPFLEGTTVWFCYTGEAGRVEVLGDFNRWDPEAGLRLKRLTGTDLWYRSAEFEMDARLDYKLVLNGNEWVLDPLNPRTIAGGYGLNSELAMPAYRVPWEITERPNIPHGTFELRRIRSTATDTTYEVRIYLPPNYDPDRIPGYPTAYFQDGLDALTFGHAGAVLDNIIDSAVIDPILAVFVQPNDRFGEYGGDLRQDYAVFFTGELVPWIDSLYNTVPDASHRAVLGPSLAANSSAYIAYTYPAIFGNCGIQSGAMWVNDNEVFDMITLGQPVDVRMSNIWSNYEGTEELMAVLRDYFESAGYAHLSYSLPEGHSWGMWRGIYDDMLHFFFGRASTPSGR